MKLHNLVGGVEGFVSAPQPDQIKLFAWYLHTHGAATAFGSGDITACYDEVSLPRPANVAARLASLAARKEVVRHPGGGYKLALPVRQKFDQAYGQRPVTIEIHKLLTELPGMLSTPAESDYLQEALICLRSQAFRGAIVMTWNVCYHHLTQWIVDKHVAAFNAQVAQQFAANPNPKAKPKQVITRLEDFQKWGERDVIDVSYAANLGISKEVYKVLTMRLDQRNSAAHPSGSKFDQVQAEAYIADVVQNAMLKIV